MEVGSITCLGKGSLVYYSWVMGIDLDPHVQVEEI